MANTPSTTSTVAAEPINSLTAPDRLAFRTALDLFFDALRADWIVFDARTDLDTPKGQELGHAAATAWTSCVESLHLVSDMLGAHADLQGAARHLLQTAPRHFPDEFDLMKHAEAVTQLAKQQKAHPGLAQLLTEASHLLEAYRGNLALMGMRPAA